MRLERWGLWLVLVLMLSVVACARAVPYRLVGAKSVFTLVNLHPDQNQRRLYSVNYLQDGLIPLCSEVTIDKVTNRSMQFTVKPGGQKYSWIFHRSSTEPVAENLDRFFGESCDAEAVGRLSQLDQDGIRAGEARAGMSKEAVLLAIGYPPPHATPDLYSDTWTYWTSRFNTVKVKFKDGVVSVLED